VQTATLRHPPIARGARRVEPFAGALTFGASADAVLDLQGLVVDVVASDTASVAFALPTPSRWWLPLYELRPADGARAAAARPCG